VGCSRSNDEINHKLNGWEGSIVQSQRGPHPALPCTRPGINNGEINKFQIITVKFVIDGVSLWIFETSCEIENK
jgi:hypothetical protein